MTEIRLATLKDIPLINEMASVVWPYTYSEMMSKEQLEYMFEMMYSFDSIEKQMTEKKHTYFILFKDNNPQAYISVHIPENKVLYIEKIYVLPNAQGKGYGNKMLKKAQEYAHSLSLDFLRLNLNRHNNNALNFYTHLGFKIISDRDLHIGQGFYMNDYIMEKQLETK